MFRQPLIASPEVDLTSFSGGDTLIASDDPTTEGRSMDGLTALAAVVVVYTLAASRLDRWLFTAPMVFVGAGCLLYTSPAHETG